MKEPEMTESDIEAIIEAAKGERRLEGLARCLLGGGTARINPDLTLHLELAGQGDLFGGPVAAAKYGTEITTDPSPPFPTDVEWVDGETAPPPPTDEYAVVVDPDGTWTVQAASPIVANPDDVSWDSNRPTNLIGSFPVGDIDEDALDRIVEAIRGAIFCDYDLALDAARAVLELRKDSA